MKNRAIPARKGRKKRNQQKQGPTTKECSAEKGTGTSLREPTAKGDDSHKVAVGE